MDTAPLPLNACIAPIYRGPQRDPGKWVARSRFYHILRFLHFTDNNRTVDSHDRLWKIRDLFEILRTNFAKFYNPFEHLVVDEVIVKFNGRVIFKQYIPKKRKRFGIKMYKLCDSSGYSYDLVKTDRGWHNT